MTKEQNMAGKVLVVDGIKILKENGLEGAAVTRFERQLDRLEQSVTVMAGKQSDYWGTIAADRTVDPTEKKTLKKEWTVIQTDVVTLSKSAEEAGVLTEKEYNDYMDAYEELRKYLIDQIQIFDNMEKATVVPSRNEFNAHYNYYYECRDALNNRITKGLIADAISLNDTTSVPVMDISAPVIGITSWTAENPEFTEYSPAFIKFTGKLVNVSYEQPYKTIFKVFRNNETEPVKVVEGVDSSTYFIPPDTNNLKIVMYDQHGKVPYDIEPIDFVTRNSGITLHLSNKYQTFYSNVSGNSNSYFTTRVIGYNGLEERPVEITQFPEVPGFDFEASGNFIKIKPIAELYDEGSIEFGAFVEAIDGQVYGLYDDATGETIVIGLPPTEDSKPIVMGYFWGQEEKVTFNYVNIEKEEFRYDLNDTQNKYLGAFTNLNDLPTVLKKGDYFLYTGFTIDGSIYKKGLTYIFDGINWKQDYNLEHTSSTVTDMLAMNDGLSNVDKDAQALILAKTISACTAFLNNLFSQKITVMQNGSIQSEDYAEGLSGFCLKSLEDGQGNKRSYIEIGDGLFRGSIDSGPLLFSKAPPGAETVSIPSGKNCIEIKTILSSKGFSSNTLPGALVNYGGKTYTGLTISCSTIVTSGSNVEVFKENYRPLYPLDPREDDPSVYLAYNIFKYSWSYERTIYTNILKIGDITIINETLESLVISNKKYERIIDTNRTYGSYPIRSDIGFKYPDNIIPTFSTVSGFNVTFGSGSYTMLFRDLPQQATNTMPKGTVYVDNGYLKIKQ